MSKKITPAIRFKGFTDAWEQRKVADMVNRVSTSSESGALPGVEYEDIESDIGLLKKDISKKNGKKLG